MFVPASQGSLVFLMYIFVDDKFRIKCNIIVSILTFSHLLPIWMFNTNILFITKATTGITDDYK